MKLLPASPVVFREPLSQPPESAFLSVVRGALGTAVLVGNARGELLALRFTIPADMVARQIKTLWGTQCIRDAAPFGEVIDRVHAYLEGDPSPISAVVRPVWLTPFTVEIHRLLTRIPFGETCRYGDIAGELGNPKAARSVGGACGRNQVLVVVPCHRVIAAGGLGGFGAGLDLKRRLLAHEHIEIETSHKRRSS